MAASLDKEPAARKSASPLVSLLRKIFRFRQGKKRRLTGAEWEARAAGFLSRKHWRILARNVRMRLGEIDIVALDGGQIVFVEVKQRRSTEFGGGEYAIGRRKRRRLINAAKEYLVRNHLTERPCRFDTIIIHTGVWPPEFVHTENAFEDDTR